jgi:hypothetical protein
MNKNLLVIIISSIFVFVNSAQATIIDVYDFKGTFDSSTIGDLKAYSIKLNGDNPVPLGQFNINERDKIQPSFASTILKDMLQRTFNPSVDDVFRDSAIAEFLSNNRGDFIYGHIEWLGDLDYGATQLYIRPIPDLSENIINNLYFDSFIVKNESTVDYDIRLLADVSPAPVPEPSSFILLAIGVAGFGFMRRRGMDKKDLSPSCR